MIVLERILRDDGRVAVAALAITLVGADVGSGRRTVFLKPKKSNIIEYPSRTRIVDRARERSEGVDNAGVSILGREGFPSK